MKVNELFRQQALESATKRLDGNVILINVPSFSLLSGFLIVLVLTTLLFVSQSKFSKYERVDGILKSVGGELKVFPFETGVVRKLFVSEGQEVQAGEDLMIIRTSVANTVGQSDKEREKRQIETQIANLSKQKHLLAERYRFEQQQIENNLASAENRQDALKRQLQLTQQQIAIHSKLLEAKERMFLTGNISDVELENERIDLLSIKAREQEYNADLDEIIATIKRLNNDAQTIPNREATELSDVENDIALLQRQLIQLENQIEYRVQASQPGIVTNIVAPEGELALRSFPLLSIASLDNELVAELYVPSRASAFIEQDLEVYVRFDAFPHQYYGDIKGKIYEVSNVLLFPDDWPNPLGLKQPVYRVKVQLDSQSIMVHGEPTSLQQGLRLTADIMLERRSILDYLLSPILEIKNNLH